MKPSFHKTISTKTRTNFDQDKDQLARRMIAQPRNRFVFCVMVMEFAVNGNQA